MAARFYIERVVYPEHETRRRDRRSVVGIIGRPADHGTLVTTQSVQVFAGGDHSYGTGTGAPSVLVVTADETYAQQGTSAARHLYVHPAGLACGVIDTQLSVGIVTHRKHTSIAGIDAVIRSLTRTARNTGGHRDHNRRTGKGQLHKCGAIVGSGRTTVAQEDIRAPGIIVARSGIGKSSGWRDTYICHTRQRRITCGTGGYPAPVVICGTRRYAAHTMYGSVSSADPYLPAVRQQQQGVARGQHFTYIRRSHTYGHQYRTECICIFQCCIYHDIGGTPSVEAPGGEYKELCIVGRITAQ